MTYATLLATAAVAAYSTTPVVEPTPAPIVTDTWQGKDKRDHLVGSIGLGLIARSITTDPYKATGLCMIPGVLKEVYDARKGHAGAWSNKDLVADLVGCGIGVGTGVYLSHKGIWFTKDF